MKNASSLFAIAAGIAALTIVGSASDAVALGNEPPGASNQCLSVLHLTYHQDLQIDRLRDSSVRRSAALDIRIDQKQAEAWRLSHAYRPSPYAIARAQSELNALRDRRLAVWVDFEARAQSILNPIQRARYTSCLAYAAAPPRAIAPRPAMHAPASPYRRERVAGVGPAGLVQVR